MEYVSQAHLLRKQAIEESRMMQGKIMVNVFNKLLSDGCTVMKISEVSSINMGQSPPGLSYNTLGDGVPLLNGPTEFGERYPTAIQWTTAPTKLCKEGDILICVRGATTGRMNWADREYCIGRGLAALTPRKEICNAEYVYYFVETQTQQMLALAAGSTFPNLPGAKLRKLDIPIPSLDKQHKIVEYLSTLEKRMDELGKLQQETGKEIKRLIPRVLDKAFKGNL
jgi:type I restriction enzyme S subunit